jgi:two-component system, chemotaxis family, protein-glutamate methylesterase/glutaminase
LSGQAEALEAHLSLLFGALIEEATVAKRLRREPLFAENSYTAEGLSHRAVLNQVSEWLHQMSGLVDPDPSMPGRV